MVTPSPAHSHVAVVAFPFGTHAAPLLSVVHRLAAASSPETIFSFFNTTQSNHTIFTTMSAGGGGGGGAKVKAYDVWDGVPEGHTFTRGHQEPIELFMKAAPQSLRLSIDKAVAETGKEVTCLVTDAFFWFAADMAQDMGVPWLPFWTAGPCTLSAHLYTDLIRHQAGSGNESLGFIAGMSKIQVQDLPEGVVFGDLESYFSTMLHQMGLMLPRATAVFMNSFEELDKTITDDMKSKLQKFLSVGPFNLALPPPPAQDESGCLPWLDKQEAASVVYIGFGSVVVLPKEELMAIAEALESSGVSFIWSLKENGKANLPKGFLEKTKTHGKVVAWAPQRNILSHKSVGVFVSHCGWNSLLESIAGGVPMICRPFFGDQRINGRMIEDGWEIGIKIDGGVFTKQGMESCLDVVLSQEKGKKMRENLKVLKELATKAVGPSGSSTENFKQLLHLINNPSAA
ncbi:anthocyanidin 3-O-glucosyltransferase 7-like isoform X2 [Humulus lupulus]|uniref:anthocyanidin 3-O-glucosyltransferase 7-like isoform X2 n=1 Tax=Humulus lupulus TaxID=3486 RepID=UPI002B40FB2E|nr:anthocyanidin 3-O-glucosyltransferase 7-like isoform X2 [Humulus lupulus]